MTQRARDEYRHLCLAYTNALGASTATPAEWTERMQHVVAATSLPSSMVDCQHVRVKALAEAVSIVSCDLETQEQSDVLAKGFVAFMELCELDPVASVGAGLRSDAGDCFVASAYTILQPAMTGWMALPYQALKTAIGTHLWDAAKDRIAELTVETAYGRRPRYMAAVLESAGKTYETGHLEVYEALWALALKHDWFWVDQRAQSFLLHFNAESALAAMTKDFAALHRASGDPAVQRATEARLRHVQACRVACLAGLQRLPFDPRHPAVAELESAAHKVMTAHREGQLLHQPVTTQQAMPVVALPASSFTRTRV